MTAALRGTMRGNKGRVLLAALALLPLCAAAAHAGEARAQLLAAARSEKAFGSTADGNTRRQAAVKLPAGAWRGMKSGWSKGGGLVWEGVMAAPNAIVVEGVVRQQSRRIDGPRKGNGWGRTTEATGYSFGSFLSLPALALAFAGSVLGAVAGGVVGAFRKA